VLYELWSVYHQGRHSNMCSMSETRLWITCTLILVHRCSRPWLLCHGVDTSTRILFTHFDCQVDHAYPLKSSLLKWAYFNPSPRRVRTAKYIAMYTIRRKSSFIVMMCLNRYVRSHIQRLAY